MFRKGLFVACILILLLAVPASVSANGPSLKDGAVFLMTNATSGNQVIAYYRADDGTLTKNWMYDTGGLGPGVGNGVPVDPLGSQNGLVLSGSWLFAVNAASNQVSVFRVGQHSLELTDTVSSNGVYPNSLTFRDGVLYVLNAAGDGNITGFSLSDEGKLTPIPGSSRSLHAATPNNGNQPDDHVSPGQISFTPDGKFLIVAGKRGSGIGRMLVYSVSDHVPSADFTATSTGAGAAPFAFAFDPFGHIAVVDTAMGAVTTYSTAAGGSLTTLGMASIGKATAPCWIVSNGTYLFSDNTVSGSISAFSTTASGAVTNLNGSGGAAVEIGTMSFPVDMGVSSDGQFEYSFESGAGAIGIYQINKDGSLSFVGIQGGLPKAGGYEGMAVH